MTPQHVYLLNGSIPELPLLLIQLGSVEPYQDLTDLRQVHQ